MSGRCRREPLGNRGLFFWAADAVPGLDAAEGVFVGRVRIGDVGVRRRRSMRCWKAGVDRGLCGGEVSGWRRSERPRTHGGAFVAAPMR